MPRKTKTGRRTVSRWQKTTNRVARPWSREEIAFMRKFYKRFETSWCARQLGRTVYSVRYKAVDLCIKKANPSVWRGNKGPANSFNFKTSNNRPTTRRTKTTRKTTTARGFRASSKRQVTRRATSRRTIRRRNSR